MALSGPAFREALAHFATGVTVVTARVRGAGGDMLVGFTATSFASVSLTPPLILVCVNHAASAHGVFVQADLFGVSVLAEHQYPLAEQFARKGIDRFADVKLVATSEAPLLEGAIAQLECRTYGRHEVGDHTVVFGEVLAVHTSPARPLLHFARRFATLGGDPAPPKEDEAIDD
jgi:flavin reductase (DIM6/NTAB) family NADH-FMN oxidoreductase RutF